MKTVRKKLEGEEIQDPRTLKDPTRGLPYTKRIYVQQVKLYLLRRGQS